MRHVFATFTFLASILLASLSFAQNFPALTGRVVDNAQLIDAESKAKLVAKLEAFETKTSHQVVVASVRDLQGYEIADFSNRLFRAWKLGTKEKNNGVLLLIAAKERKVRIEVGYGLEGVLTDATSRLIIQNALVPRFKTGDTSGGVTRAVEDILLTLEGDTSIAKAAKRGAQQESFGIAEFLPFLIFAIIVFLMINNARHANRRRLRRNDGGWVIIPSSSGWGSGGGFSDGGGFGGGGFSGGGGSSGGGGASGDW